MARQGETGVYEAKEAASDRCVAKARGPQLLGRRVEAVSL